MSESVTYIYCSKCLQIPPSQGWRYVNRQGITAPLCFKCLPQGEGQLLEDLIGTVNFIKKSLEEYQEERDERYLVWARNSLRHSLSTVVAMLPAEKEVGPSLTRARKDHVCDRCLQPIRKGADYRRVQVTMGTKHHSYAVHPYDCESETTDDE